ncbi:MAG: flagellar motor switch protein FliN [Pseudomonadota bacterium]
MAEDTTTNTAATDDLAEWGEAMAEQGLAAEPAAAAPSQPKVQPAPFAELRADQGGAAPGNQLDLVMDIPVTLSVELGRTKIQIRELLQLAQGSVVDLDRLAGEPMDVLVNGFLIARGEVVLVNDKFGIRLTDIVSPTERARRLG